MVLKKTPKRYQMIWFEEREEARLKDFVANDLKAEMALNSVCSEIVNMVLESDELRRIAQQRIDARGVQKGTGIRKVCEFCGTYCMSDKHRIDHERTCKKRPLVMEVRAR